MALFKLVGVRFGVWRDYAVFCDLTCWFCVCVCRLNSLLVFGFYAWLLLVLVIVLLFDCMTFV